MVPGPHGPETTHFFVLGTLRAPKVLRADANLACTAQGAGRSRRRRPAAALRAGDTARPLGRATREGPIVEDVVDVPVQEVEV
jgi:hypothetical protein